MTIWSGLSFLLRETSHFLKKAWWLAAFLTLPDLFVEYLIRQPETSNWEIWASELFGLGLHLIRLFLELLVFFVFIRFIALDHDLRHAFTTNGSALRSFAPFALAYIAFGLSVSYVVTAVEAPWLPALLRSISWPLLALWAVSAPGGGKPISPIQSARIAFPNLPWSILFLLVLGLVVTLTTLAIGNLLSSVGIGPGWLTAAVLIVSDGVEVIVAFAAIFVIAQKSGLVIQPLSASDSLEEKLS